MDMDSFFVSCERQLDRDLNQRPIIIGGSRDRGVVACASDEAIYYGVRTAMPMRMALQLCPQAKVLRGDMELYAQKSNEINSIIQDTAPLYEQAGLDQFYLDVSGMDRFFGCHQWTSELAVKIQKESGLPLTFALSVNKTVARMASAEVKPQGQLFVDHPFVKPFLNPLSIRKIPSLGQQAYQLLSRIGVRKIKTLSEMPVEMLHSILGKPAKSIWEKAQGIDNSPVLPNEDQGALSKEKLFRKDSIDIRGIKNELTSMVEALAFELRSKQKLVSKVTVKIRYSNSDTHVRSARIPFTCLDHQLISLVHDLFDQLFERRMLIRKVGVRFSYLVEGAHQIQLFEDSVEQIALYQAMDSMRRKYGMQSVGRSSAKNFRREKVRV